MQVKNIQDIKWFTEKFGQIDSVWEYNIPSYGTHQTLPTFVAEFENCFVHSNPAFVVTAEQEIITSHVGPLNWKTKRKPKHGCWTNFEQDKVNLNVPPVTKQFNEFDTYVWLPFETISANNPWHVWIDMIGKFRLLEKRFNKAFANFVFVLSQPSKYFEKVAKELFPSVHFMVMPPKTCWRFKHLICPSMLNSKDGVVLPTLPQWLHHRFAPKYDKPNKKVYIDRKYSPSRRLTNAEELMIALKGFEVQNLEDLSIKDQMKLFASATTVVSTHGAGLVNLLWCKKNTKVIEITHEDSNKKVYPGLSLHLQLKHKVLVGQKIPIPMDSPEKKLHRLNDYNDIKLDSSILLRNLE